MNSDLVAQHAIDKLARDGIAALSETERTTATAWLFAAGVGNAGFLGYLGGHRGDLAAFAPAALRTIGAPKLAGLAERANALLGPEAPPADRAARKALVDNLPAPARHALADLDRCYLDCEEDIDELLEKYLNRQP